MDENAIIYIEDLSIDGMKLLRGRKVSNLAFAEFVNILEWKASQVGTTVVEIDRWAPFSKVCSVCGTLNTELSLKQREWTCGILASIDAWIISNRRINLVRDVGSESQ